MTGRKAVGEAKAAGRKPRRLAAALHLRRRARPGSAPGTLVVDPDAFQPVLRITSYDNDSVEEIPSVDVERAIAMRGKRAMVWIDVCGLADLAVIRRLGEAFGLHSLSLEDVVNLHQRAKVEDYESHLFIVARMLVAGRDIESEQLSIFIGDNYLLTFQERPGDCLDPVRERLRRGGTRLRQSGPDFLAYALIDAVIDGYYPVLERYGEAIETLEDDVLAHPDPEQVDRLHALKRDLLNLRRSIWPTREMVHSLERSDSGLVTSQTRIYLRDCYDHAIQLMDVVETYREITSGLLDVYLSSMSAKMNEIMKVLTIIATIFIPLSFIASDYGMNFNTDSPWNMPELDWRFGYPFALALMASVAGGLVWWMRRRRWLGGRQ